MSIDLICTIGPASSAPSVLKEMALGGMTIARLNMSHGDHESHRKAVAAIRAAAKETGRAIALMGDLQGPKIRLGAVNGDSVRLERGSSFVLDRLAESGGQERAALDNESVMADIRVGDTILINDGEVKLRATEASPDRIMTEVVVGGTIASRKGVNMPGTRLRLPALTDKDKIDIRFLVGEHVDWLACSFVREAAHLAEIRDFLGSLAIGTGPKLVAKIETVHAVRNFTTIREASDGIMIARGDLGVEMSFERVPLVQKAMLRECTREGTYVITATQMLQSMVEHPVPTRAETSDVFQAVYEGSNAVMLSAESSVGRYPAESVKALGTIARFAESARSMGEEGIRTAFELGTETQDE